MNEKYVCGLCGKTHTDLDEYMNCVLKCGEKLKELEKEEKEKKRLIELNSALNGVKQAKDYYEQKLNEFKEKYPEEYELNFGSEDCHGNCKCKSNEKENTSKKVEVKITNDGKGSKIDASINGKKVDDEIIKELSTDPEIEFFAKMLGLL